MKHHFKRLIALCLCLVIVAAYILTAPLPEANAAMYSSYTTIAKISTQGGCNAMQ